jgi:taurine dioxygenase|tara:strand:- start:10600 stop:11508 length:909 start_codon:yes stop_codon:yes gene_type:complete
MDFTVCPLSGGVGVEVLGLDPDNAISEASARALRDLWLDAGVILFRGIGTSPEALLNISRCLGDLEPHPIEHFRLPGYPELILLSNEKTLTGPVYEFDGVATYGRIPWHTDLAFTTTPNAGAVLRMVRNSEHGGQTGWIDTALAYDALDAATQKHIEGLEARYIFCPDLSAMRFNTPGGKLLKSSIKGLPTFPPVAHPLVWVHPETGRRILNISTLNIQCIEGMPQAESDALIEKLVAHTLQPRFQYIHLWENNDVVAWDNRRTMHMAFGHPVDETRIVQRSTIRGTVKMGRVIETCEEQTA